VGSTGGDLLDSIFVEPETHVLGPKVAGEDGVLWRSKSFLRRIAFMNKPRGASPLRHFFVLPLFTKNVANTPYRHVH
jgi:hypothetical protein